MIDARLLVPATGTWLGAALCGVWLRGAASASERHHLAHEALLSALIAIGALAIVSIPLVRIGTRTRTVLIACGAGLIGVLVGAAWTVRACPEPVAGWLDARATADVVAVVTDEPRVRSARGGVVWADSAWVEVRVRAEVVSARGQRVQVRVPLLLRLPMGAEAPAPGTLIHTRGRLGPATDSGGAVGSVRAGPDTTEIIGAPGPLQRLAHAMRVGLRASLIGTAPDAGALVAGLALGDESLQPPGLAEEMRASGLAHLTAVSGGNVAIVLGLALAAAAVLRLRLWLRVVIAGGALGFFVLLVGAQPSVLRAAVMGAAALVAIVAGGRRAGPSVLSVAVLVLVVLQPWLALSWGFALSVLATAGLILLAPILRARITASRIARRWPPALLDAVALTLAAQLATLPVLVAMGAAVGWVSVPANLAAMPAVAPVTVLGLASAALSVGWPTVAQAGAHLAAWPAGWIAEVAAAGAAAPGARLPWPSGWTGVGAVAIVLAGGWIGHRAWTRWLGVGLPTSLRRGIAAAVVLGAGLLAVLPPSQRGWPPPGWFLIACDVGQGDGLLLRSGDRHAVVVDAGPDPDLIDACLADADIEAVDAVVLTHFHADHVRGLAGVLRGRSVGSVLVTPVREPSAEADDVDTLLASRHLAAEAITAGDVREVGDVHWRALWPRRRIDSGSVPNNASVVLVVTVRGRTVWLGGDVEPEAQTAMAADLRPLHLDVVKVPHHGSANQRAELPVWAFAPVAVVSVGAGNDYGHPAAQTLAAWEAVGAMVARTDEDGDIAVVSTDSGIGVVTRRDMLPSS